MKKGRSLALMQAPLPLTPELPIVATGEEVGLVLDAAGVAWQLEGWQGSGSSRSSNSQQEPPNEAEAGVTGKGDRDRQYAATGTEAAKPAAKTRRLTAPDDGRALLGPRDIGLALTQVPFEHCVKIVQVNTRAHMCFHLFPKLIQALMLTSPHVSTCALPCRFAVALSAAWPCPRLSLSSLKIKEALSSLCALQVCCGAQHCLAVSAPAPAAGFPSGGLAFSWGWNGLGAAGQGSQLQVQRGTDVLGCSGCRARAGQECVERGVELRWGWNALGGDVLGAASQLQA